MENNVKAVFYKYKYYILPPEYADISKIVDGEKINAKRLKEVRCMAPDFIYESIEEETLEVEDASLLFEVNVNLYSGKEYDALLSKQIDRVCHGCKSFIDDGDETLDGHHREISLDGVCYERVAEGDVPSYALRVYWFWCEISEKTDEIKACIDAGNMKKLDKICKSCGYIDMPTRFFGDKKDGKHRLFWQCFPTGDVFYNLLCFTAQAAYFESSPIRESGLEVIPFIPEDADLDLSKFNANGVTFKVAETASRSLCVNVCFKKKLSDKKINDFISLLHIYLCKKFGENALLCAVEEYCPEVGAEGETFTLEALERKITEAISLYGDITFPPAHSVGWENVENPLFGRSNYEGSTKCYDFTCMGADKSYGEDFVFGGNIAYACLHVPVTVSGEDKAVETLVKYFSAWREVPEPVFLKEEYLGCFVHIGGGFCQNGADGRGDFIVLEFILTDEKAFYRFIKILAPILEKYNARLIVYNDGGANEFVCGYKITAADGSGVN